MKASRKLLFFLFIKFGLTWAAPPPHAIPQTPISLTVSGGVSLGSYQAGYLYYSAEFFRLNRLNFEIKEVTGASAGAINSFLSILSNCSLNSDSLKDSLFWKTWIPVGFKELIGTPPNQRPSAIFTAETLEKSAVEIERVWNQGLSSDCDRVMGVTTTLLKPEQDNLGEGIQAIHQEVPFMLRIRGKGPRQPPEITNYVRPDTRVPQALLYLPEDPHEKFIALRNLLLASSAFPGAFPPRLLKYCLTKSGQPLKECTAHELKDVKEEYFVDGGVFDNQPLRLAIRTAAHGLLISKQGNTDWKDVPDLDHLNPPPQMHFHALDVDAKTYPAEPPSQEEQISAEQEPFLTYLRRFLTRFISTARSQQLYTVFEENPNLSQSLSSTRNHFPLASEPGLAFFGFFDRGFREYDFYMGMFDARRNLNQKLVPHAHKKLSYPEEVGPESTDWNPLYCMRAKLDHVDGLEKFCDSPKLANFKKLLQLSLNRLYSNCSLLPNPESLQKYPSNDCKLAYQGHSPPLMDPKSQKMNDWKKLPDEDDVHYYLRFLTENNYRFELLKSSNASSKEVLTELRTQFLTSFRHLADRQPAMDRFVLKFAGEPAFNLIRYRPPPHEFHFLLGELIEGGGSLALSDLIRFHSALTIHRIQDAFTDGFGKFSLAPFLGFELEAKSLSTAWIQPRLGSRIGWQLTPSDHWGSQTCVIGTGTVSSSGDSCTRWAFEPYLAATIYQRLRIQIVERILPGSRGLPTQWDSFLQLGIELTP